MKRIFVVLSLLLVCCLTYSQELVKGTVVEAHSGVPLIVTEVMIRGDVSSKVYTNIDGYYEIKIPDFSGNTILVFSNLGYRTQELSVYDSHLDVKMIKGLEIKKKEKVKKIWKRPSFVVKGQVLGVGENDIIGDPIVGTVVSVNGTDVEVVTDADGYYEITVPENIKNPELCFQYIVMQQIIPINESVEVLDAYLYYSVPADFEAKVRKLPQDIVDEYEEIIVYEPVDRLPSPPFFRYLVPSLIGSLSQTNFGIECSLGMEPSKLIYLNLDGGYHTNFENNSRFFVNLEWAKYFGLVGVKLKTGMDVLDIPEKNMDINIYRGDIYFEKIIRNRFTWHLGVEYIDHKSKYMQGITSAILGTKFRIRYTDYLFADIGIPDRGEMSFFVGYTHYATPKVPLSIDLKAGTWMGELRVDANISKRVKRVVFRLGYEKLYKYENAYLKLSLPLL